MSGDQQRPLQKKKDKNAPNFATFAGLKHVTLTSSNKRARERAKRLDRSTLPLLREERAATLK